MPFNGAGTFNRLYSWVTDAANGIFVSSTRTDADTDDIATGLSTCITKDGQTTVTANIPMAGFKFTGLAVGTATTDSARVDNANSYINEFRLTLTSGTPVTTSDVTAATTIYCTPYKGNHIALYDGTNWHMRTSSEFSLALGTLTAGVPYDVFCYDNSGTPTLEFLAWSTATARATALTYQDGVLSKTGALTRRYLGTFMPYSTTQPADSAGFRLLWNYYNRARKFMRVVEATASWSYSSATIRAANNSSSNRLSFLIGVDEDVVSSYCCAQFSSNTANDWANVGIGLDTTTAITSGCLISSNASSAASSNANAVASLQVYPGVGFHYLSWNESSHAGGTVTWVGVSGSFIQSGIHGEIFC